MNAGRTIARIAAAVLIFFGVLFIWGAFSEQGTPGWILIGVIGLAAGLGLIWFTRPRDESSGKVEVVQRIELSGDVDLDNFQCRNCGGAITVENVEMLAGAPVVTCPWCGSVYQLTEEPKW